MPKGKNRGGGGGFGGIVISALILAVLGGLIFAVAKANNINNAGALIDWARTTSAATKDCMQPDIKFWTCFNGIGDGSSAPGGEGSEGGDAGSGSEGGSEGTPGQGGSEPGADTPAVPAPDAELQKLAALKVGEPQEVDYDRGQWKHWIGDRCNDTRQQVLREQAVSFKLDAEGCRVSSGEWLDPYTGETFTDPSKLDIDHVYALGAAAKNGGNGWDAAKKQEFANDKSHLLAVSASANRSKSDRNPAEWWPENEAYSCDFATKYVDVAAKYELQFSEADVKVLEKGLKTCG